MTKDLKERAIDFKGKKYVLVADRINYFNETYPNGAIYTHLKSEPEDKMVIVEATVVPDASNGCRYFIGHSQAVWGDSYINKTSALENAETSAVGRALAMMGIGVIESVASIDEIKKATQGIDGLSGEEEHLAGKEAARAVVHHTAPNPEIEDVMNKEQAAFVCKVHEGALMKQRFAKNGSGTWFDHRKEDPKDSGNWWICNGVDGWKAQKQHQAAA